MSGQATSIPGYQWTEAPQDLIPALNATGLPIVRVDALAVTGREMIEADMIAIAGGVAATPHLSYTFVADIAVPAISTVDLVNVTWTGAVPGKFILINDPGLLLVDIFAYVTATNTVHLIARNYGSVDSAVPNGTVVKMALV